MIKWLVKTLLRNRYVYDLAKGAYNEATSESNRAVNVDVPEATPFDFCNSELAEKRINLLVPALSEKHVFGGIATALRFFELLKEHYPIARIIVTDETSTTLKNNQYYSDWKVLDIGQSDVSGNSIVVAGNRVGRALPISKNDYFVTTAWWTAINAFKMLNWQEAAYSLEEKRKLIYFVQDFEPGFYSWSSRYALADSTYKKPTRTIPIFNTKLLSDFFDEQGYSFEHSFHFNPKLNPVLDKLRKDKIGNAKEKQILIYGRPSVERNLFSIIIQSLKCWAEKYDSANEWKVYSAGEQHDPIEIGHNIKVESVGKLSLDEYAEILSRSSVGISLMLSPHPSYPPLEMAMFGVNVVSNTYANKDLTALVSNVINADSLDPDDLSSKIIECCENHSESSSSEYINKIFSDSGDEFPFIHQLVEII